MPSPFSAADWEGLPLKKRLALLAVLLLAAYLSGGCAHSTPDRENKLLVCFEGLGYSCEIRPMEAGEREVPIYDASVWQLLTLDGSYELLVYFDESNRADYHLRRLDRALWPHAARLGLRYLVVYQGADPGVAAALEKLQNQQE